MAPPRRKRTSPAFGEEMLEAVLTQLRERLNAEGAVKLSTLKPAALREAVEQRLLAEGFEMSGAFVRRPIAAQLHDALARDGAVSWSELPRVVRGASRTELERDVRQAAARGELRHALRSRAEIGGGPSTQRSDDNEVLVVGAGQSVIEGKRLTTLRDTCTDLAKLLDAASKKKNVGLLASDVEHMLSAALRVLDDSAPKVPTVSEAIAPGREATGAASRAGTPGAHAARSSGPLAGARGSSARALDAATTLTRLLAAVDAVRDERTGMSFVPAIVQRLSSDMAVTTVQEALLSAARRELIELRPEGGLGRLSREELALCPPGPAGSRLSWVRRSTEAGA